MKHLVDAEVLEKQQGERTNSDDAHHADWFV